MLLGLCIAGKFVIESSFVQKYRRSAANDCEIITGSTVTAVRKLEAVREGQSDRLGTVTMSDGYCDEI